MKLVKIFLIATLAIAFGACGGAATEKAKTDEKPETTTEKKDEATPEKKDEAPAKSTTDDSPTKALTEFAKAFQEKDLIGVKKRFSFKTLQVITKDAIAKGGNGDEAIKAFMDKTDLPFKGVPETQNEKIDGETATVEVKANDKWVPMPLVLEDGKWRISFDKGKPGG